MGTDKTTFYKGYLQQAIEDALEGAKGQLNESGFEKNRKSFEKATEALLIERQAREYHRQVLETMHEETFISGGKVPETETENGKEIGVSANRLAASRCRKRKQLYKASLEEMVYVLTRELLALSKSTQVEASVFSSTKRDRKTQVLNPTIAANPGNFVVMQQPQQQQPQYQQQMYQQPPQQQQQLSSQGFQPGQVITVQDGPNGQLKQVVVAAMLMPQQQQQMQFGNNGMQQFQVQPLQVQPNQFSQPNQSSNSTCNSPTAGKPAISNPVAFSGNFQPQSMGGNMQMSGSMPVQPQNSCPPPQQQHQVSSGSSMICQSGQWHQQPAGNLMMQNMSNDFGTRTNSGDSNNTMSSLQQQQSGYGSMINNGSGSRENGSEVHGQQQPQKRAKIAD